MFCVAAYQAQSVGATRWIISLLREILIGKYADLNLDRAINIITRRIGINSDTAGIADKIIHRITGLKFSPARSGVSTSIEQRMNMYHLASQVIAYNVEGDLVEVGCNKGQSSVLFAKVINSFNSSKKLHVYDSFEGLPSARTEDGDAYKKGDLATTQDVLLNNFKLHGLEPPAIHKGWFVTLSRWLARKGMLCTLRW